MSTNHHQGLRLRIRLLRRSLRNRISRIIAGYFGTAQPVSRPLDNPQRILICRLNSRIGNVLFLTPLIQSLAGMYPGARIEVIISEPEHCRLLAGLPGVQAVHAMPDTLRAVFRLLREIRRKQFDLAIDPMPHSESGRIALLLSGARARLGFAADHQWLRLDHAAAIDYSIAHEAQRPLALLDRTLGETTPAMVWSLGISPREPARRTASRLLHQLAGFEGDANSPRLAFFAEATGMKSLPPEWWRDWLLSLRTARPDVRLFQLMRPGEESNTLDNRVTGFAVDDLEVLAALLRAFDGFVAADGGPMHLAAAAGVPVLGVFGYTEPEYYRPLGPRCISARADQGPAALAEMALTLLSPQRQLESLA